jgi:hypothetical protein
MDFENFHLGFVEIEIFFKKKTALLLIAIKYFRYLKV